VLNFVGAVPAKHGAGGPPPILPHSTWRRPASCGSANDDARRPSCCKKERPHLRRHNRQGHGREEVCEHASSLRRETQNKTNAPQQNEQSSKDFEGTPVPFPFYLDAPAPVINVYAGKHAGEVSECTSGKDWKEWGAFAWCRTWEWVDAARVIAIFTAILGLATWKLWRSTSNLVIGADEIAKRKMRAYVTARKMNLDTRASGMAMWRRKIPPFPSRPSVVK
jgi:hypothetical protein